MFEPTQERYVKPLLPKILLVGIFTLIGLNASAVTYYVNDHSRLGDVYTLAIGNDQQDGLSPATPKLTLTAVYEVAKEGDVIYIDTGSYPDRQSPLIQENKKKLQFFWAPQKAVLLSKESIPPTQKTNPAEFYIENDQPVDRGIYLQHKRKESKKS